MRRGGDDDGVDLVGRDSAGLEGLTTCRDGHLHDVFLGIGEAPVLDSRAGLDPLVARVDEFTDLVVGHDSLGAVNAESE